MGVEVDAPAAAPAKTHAEEVHDHRVIGGLKAATHNPVRRPSPGLADPTERVRGGQGARPREYAALVRDVADACRARGYGRVGLVAAVRAMHL